MIDLFRQRLPYKETKKDNEISINCPNCADNKFHLGVNFKIEAFHCFKCGFSGRLKKLLKILFNIEAPGIYNIEKTLAEERKQKININLKPIKLPPDFYTLSEMFSNPIARPYIDYAISRGLSLTQIDYFQAGISLKERPGYIIFPIFDMNGKQIYWTSRAIRKGVDLKSYNPPALGDEYGRSSVLFNFNNAIRYKNVYITEGPFDCITYAGPGVALLGKSLSDFQFSLLLKADFDIYHICLDPEVTTKSFEMADRFLNYGKRVMLIKYPDDRDLNDLYVDDDMYKIRYFEYKGLRM